MHPLFNALIINKFSLFSALFLNIFLIIFNKKSLLYWIVALIFYICFNIFYISILLYFQYQLWYYHPISKHLLPPYSPIFYFISYTYHHIYKEFLWSLIGAFLILLIMQISHRIFKKTLFYPEEFIKVPILSIFLEFPFQFIFFISGLFLILLIHLSNFFKLRESIFEKISFKDYWPFLSLFFIIFNIYVDFKMPYVFNVIKP